ncbi:MAG: UDP-N-acetylmuramoyl-tripeptide--D-alanyl-D-alanine ligase [Alcanivoracaceae bacterium]|nr:UDP-N-acetylmuramoyl-tripeptide--D-alanyl-D-alanine ligase [Alcanivoracaceae bacterium]
MKLSQVAQATAGQLVGKDMAFARVSTDTRSIEPGDLFVALRGERFDAHEFLSQAAASGACAALVEKDDDAFDSYVRVADTRIGFGKLAAAWADQFDVVRIAVTGNAGKTSVKEMIACMLGDQVLATQGNLNNDIGVPLTLLRLNDEHRFGVFELGANAPGEIAWTSSLVHPVIAMITNVTGAHLEGFGSMQGIADAKSEIFSGMKEGDTAIINSEDSFADFFAAQARKQGLVIRRVGFAADNDAYADQLDVQRDLSHARLHVDGQVLPMTVPLAGRHQVINALMAIAAVRDAGVSVAEALQRLARLAPVKGRMNLVDCLGGTLVDDSYNANPGSVRVAIDWLKAQPAPRALVLGALGELGPTSDDIHRELGRYAAEAGLDHLVVVAAAAPAAQGFGARAQQVADATVAAQAVKDVLEQGGTVLVKGSRSARMEAVIEALRAMGGQH